MTYLRRDPYVHVAWIKKLVVGDYSCEWAAWFKAHHGGYAKQARDSNLANWKADHAALIANTRDGLRADGNIVRIEGQNEFRLRGSYNALLAGQPDIIVSESEDSRGTIYECKTGKPNDGDIGQTLIYMWAVPLALPRYEGFKFNGEVVYKDHSIHLPHERLTPDFISNLRSLIKRIVSPEPAFCVPSKRECGFCDLTTEDCAERTDGGDFTNVHASDLAF